MSMGYPIDYFMYEEFIMKKNKFSRRHCLVILFGFLLYYFYTAAIPDGMNVILPQISSSNNLNYDVLLSFATIAGIISTVVVLQAFRCLSSLSQV